MTIKEVLQQCTVEANIIKLPDIDIHKHLQNHVNKKLEEIGGEWKEEKNGFEFVTDPTVHLQDLINAMKDNNDIELTELKADPAIIDTHTNFFQQLAAMGNVDVTIRIMQKGDKLTIGIDPGLGSSQKPYNITGTPAELDEEFFKTIAPGITEIKGIVSNLDDVKKSASEKKDDKKNLKFKQSAKKPAYKKPAPKKSPAKKTAHPKKVVIKKEKPVIAKKEKVIKPPAEKKVEKPESDFVSMGLE